MSDGLIIEGCSCLHCTQTRKKRNELEQLTHLTPYQVKLVADQAIRDKFLYKGLYEDQNSTIKELKKEKDVDREKIENLEMIVKQLKKDSTPSYEQFVEDMTLPSVKEIKDYIYGLVAEVGEFAGKVYKANRDNSGMLDKQALLLELGDIQFYVTGLANRLGFRMNEVVQANRAKLMARKASGTIQGSGDNR